MAETLLTASEIAQHLRLHVETVYRLIHQKRLPAIKIGGQWRFRQSEVEQWLSMQTEHQLGDECLESTGSVQIPHPNNLHKE